MATVTSQAENDYITARLSGDGWFGASDAATEGDWKWVSGPESGTSFWLGLGNGTSVDGEFSNWAPGEPNNSGNEDCAQFYGNGSGWNDLNCTSATLSSYVVEYGTDGANPTAPSSTSFAITTSHPSTQTVSIGDCQAFFDALQDTNEHRYDTINLTHDLDCSGYTLTSLFSEYDNDANTPLAFEGTFNGNGHTIRDLTIQPRYDDVRDDYSPTGLFGYVAGGAVENLTLANVTVGGYACTGSVVGSTTGMTLTNATVNGTVGQGTNGEWSNSKTGGIVGCISDDQGDTTMTNATFGGTVSATDWSLGGIVGYIQANNGHTITLTSPTNNATVTGNSYVGGTVGYASVQYGSALIITHPSSVGMSNQYANNLGGVIGYAYATDGSTLTMSDVTISGAIEGESNVGGVVGYLESYSDGTLTTISDSTLSHAVSTTGDTVGGVVGYAELGSYNSLNLSIANVKVTGSVSGGVTGGIVGTLYGYTEDDSYPSAKIYRSAVTGAVTSISDQDVGGLVGDGYQVLIDQSYTTGAVQGGENGAVGGLVGYMYNGFVHDSYASGKVSGPDYVGGLVGTTSGFSDFVHSYARGQVDSPGENVGGILGHSNDHSDTADNVFWDTQTTGQAASVAGTGYITRQMLTRDNYHDWDFDDVWGITGGVNNGYPCLRWTSGDCQADNDSDGVSATVENGAPNNGDGNSDGIQDSLQSNVTSFVNPVTNQYVTLEVSDDCSLTTASMAAEGSLDKNDGAYVYANGLMNFAATCNDPGTVVTVKQYYWGVSSTDGLVVRKYRDATHEYQTVTGHNLALGTQLVGGRNVVTLSYTITDGDELDTDGAVNGAIVDPIGLAQIVAAAPDTGFARIVASVLQPQTMTRATALVLAALSVSLLLIAGGLCVKAIRRK